MNAQIDNAQIERPFNYIRSGSAGRCMDELYRLICTDQTVNEWVRSTSPDQLSVKSDLKIRVTTNGRIRVRRFYWSIQRCEVSAKDNAIHFCARTLILEPESKPQWLDFPEDPQLLTAPTLLTDQAYCQVLQYVPLRRLTIIKKDANSTPVIFKLKRKGRAQEAALRLKRINDAQCASHSRYFLPNELGCCSESGALRQTVCSGNSLSHLPLALSSKPAFTQLGRVLASFHNMPLATLPVEKDDDLSDLTDTVRQLVAFWPAAKHRIEWCQDWLIRNKKPGNDLTVCHGDLSPDNLLLDGNRWSLIDLDLAHLGDPVRDVAKLLVQLYLMTFKLGNESFIPRTQLLSGYLSERPASIPSQSLSWHCCRVELEYLQVAFRKDAGNTCFREASLARAERHCLGIHP